MFFQYLESCVSFRPHFHKEKENWYNSINLHKWGYVANPLVWNSLGTDKSVKANHFL